MRIVLTGGAGFIGSSMVNFLLARTQHEVLNLDSLTYAADPDFAQLSHPRYRFAAVDICDTDSVAAAVEDFVPDAIMHLAAESHVDRSIDGPAAFLKTNILGTFSMLDASLRYWRGLSGEAQGKFRFHHISTDEVFGDLGPTDAPFSETTPYRPSSPYSASKAASDHLVRAWHRTYGLPVLVSNCSNNYGPRQFPEKLIPLIINNAIEGKALPIYGDGLQIRDWLYVEDHVDALYAVLTRGAVGETYNIGGRSERSNIDVVRTLCAVLEEEWPGKPAGVARYSDLVTSVPDRPGHDRRYAIDDRKLERELGWRPRHDFESGIRQTVRWYLENRDWCERIARQRYNRERIGLAAQSDTRAA